MEVREEGAQPARFSERMLRVLSRVEYRCANTAAEKELVQRLRYDTIGHNSIGPSADDAIDDMAHTPKTWVTTTRIDGELATAVRIDVAEDEYDTLPALEAFADVIEPLLRQARMVLEFGQTGTGFDFFKAFPEWPFVSLRPACLAAEYFHVDFVIATISVMHQAFYRRMFGFEPLCEPRQSPDSDCAISCIGLDFRANRERLEARYPFLYSTKIERDALFNRAPRQTSKSAGLRRFRPDFSMLRDANDLMFRFDNDLNAKHITALVKGVAPKGL